MMIESTLYTMELQEQKSVSLARTGRRPAVFGVRRGSSRLPDKACAEDHAHLSSDQADSAQLASLSARHVEVPRLPQRAVVVQARERANVRGWDARRVLAQDQRVGVGWVGHHQHLPRPRSSKGPQAKRKRIREPQILRALAVQTKGKDT